MRIKRIAEQAKIKGIKLMGTGDFTHPLWLNEIKKELTPVEHNLFKYAGDKPFCEAKASRYGEEDIYFILTAEVSNVYEKYGKIRKVHNIIFAPTLNSVEKINLFLSRYGALEADARPTLSLDCETMVKRILTLSPDIFIVPSHIWTPWFALFGANGGFDKIEECFGEQSKNIFALETGLSSDPPINWRWSALDRYAFISNSDAHSPENIGREANCFDCELDYFEIMNAIKSQDSEKFKFTIEFFPEEGKYHWDGHRKCETRIAPEEAIANNNICPKCGRKITIGVMHRIISLSDRKKPKSENRIPCKHLIPLAEIIADILGVGKDTTKVAGEYNKLISHYGTEFNCLLNVPLPDLKSATTPEIADAICRVREGKVNILPGYDGVYGKISVAMEKKTTSQLTFF